MLLIALFTTLSALLIVATPLPVNHRLIVVDSDSRITLYRRAPPKFEIPFNQVAKHHREDTIEKMKKHYETEATDEQKQARLARVTGRWKDLQPGREYMDFIYHTGDTTGSPVIPPMATIYRDKPAPKTHFLNVLDDHRKEMEPEIAKRFNDLHPDRAHRVRSMKVWRDWHLDGGIREKTKLTYHSSITPGINNIIGEPTTITRPLTLQFPELPSWDKLSIDHQVHAAHRKMVADPQHPAATANYGTVHSNWHDSLPDANGETHKQVIVGLEEVSENETGKKHLGNYAVRAGTRDYELIGSNAGGPSSHTAVGTSHAGLNNEVARPLNSQARQHINIDSSSESSHALSSNSRSSHLKSQGPQFNAGLSSHPGPSHPELLHAGSPQQPLQAHAGLYSGKLWDAGSPRLQSLPPNSQILPHPNSPPSQFRAGNPGPSSHLGPSHPELLLHPGSLQQPLQPHVVPPLRNEFHVQREPESQPPKGAHPGLYTGPLWHTGPPRLHSPSPNNQVLLHPNSLPSQFRADNPGPSSRSGPSHPVLPQHPVQLHTGNQPLHNEFNMQWEPESQLSKEAHGLYTDPLWHTGPPHLQSPPRNSQILPHSNSLPQFRAGKPGPSSYHGPSHPELSHASSPQQLLQQPAGSLTLHNECYIPPESRPLRDIWRTLHAHPSLFNDPIWHDDLLHPQSPPSVNQIPPYASSSSLRLGVGDPSPPSLPGPSHPGLPQQSLQPHTSNQPVHNEFYMQWRPESHPSQGTWHPSLRSGQLSHTDSSHPESPPSNLQILPRPNSPPLHPDAWSPGSAQSINTVLPSRLPSPPQVGPSSSSSESTHPDADLSPEIWHLLNPDPVYPYPWNPHQHNP